MSIEVDIWTPSGEDDGDVRQGEVIVEVIGDEEVSLHLRVAGDIVASAVLDRFQCGLLAGNLEAGASEAVKA